MVETDKAHAEKAKVATEVGVATVWMHRKRW
jgi:hypothetical protein